MTVLVRYAVASESDDQFNAALFRFIEAKTSTEGSPLRIENTPDGFWNRKVIAFDTEDMAASFRRFMARADIWSSPPSAHSGLAH